MKAQGKSIEGIDLRSIAPLDEDLTKQSVRETSRVLVAHEDALTMGFGAEVAARSAQNCFEYLDAPIRTKPGSVDLTAGRRIAWCRGGPAAFVTSGALFAPPSRSASFRCAICPNREL